MRVSAYRFGFRVEGWGIGGLRIWSGLKAPENHTKNYVARILRRIPTSKLLANSNISELQKLRNPLKLASPRTV